MTERLASMTGFARSEGVSDGASWSWELRSVNGRGLELRFRLPSGFEGLEPALREIAGKQLKRGNITANLTIKRGEAARLAIDAAALEQMLGAALNLTRRIPGGEPPRSEALLALPGVVRPVTSEAEETTRLPDAVVREGFAEALQLLLASRRGEGARLAVTLGTLLDEVEALRRTASEEAADQPAAQRARMLASLKILLAETPPLPEERIAQEVALLASRSDVREELDRLAAHVGAARTLLDEATAVGRRLDFLVQEFNREANTLCSKSASIALTATGLKLKSTIEQLREQVQNIE